ncbi:hypothetical protein ppKF707_2637 [Metapseudomonas furukawaii]|uniref:Uncharacterized protein n=1 Tax=Metapseudomonas furukawaii TaxID=1149133 RepID=A0AAD1FDP2_METFU|nr:hypothetical protein ppKF707_2637 [Pseudomonas furukawaii]BAU72895.1 hypothetical protein KF707C_12070 [Pseudomonas furukawaii]
MIPRAREEVWRLGSGRESSGWTTGRLCVRKAVAGRRDSAQVKARRDQTGIGAEGLRKACAPGQGIL